MTDSSKMVDQQLRLVEIKRNLERLGRVRTQPKIDEVQYGPCVLFSRETGSQGNDVTRAVGQRLHWHVFDREIVEQIAERAHVRNQLVESVDEHVRSRWQRLLHPIREREGLKSDTYLYHLHEIILSLGHHGYVVIAGRGAQYLLPPESALRVRVVEPLADRVRRIGSSRHISSEEAAQFVQKCEKARAEFIRNVFHQDSTSPLNYDLILNTHELSVEAAAAAVLIALEKKLGVKAEPGPCET
jgi:cytidylate kinase